MLETFIPVDLDDDELLFDVVDEINHLSEESEKTLSLLGQDPTNKDLLDKLFRSVHTIKGDIGVAQIAPLFPLLSAMEDILGLMRESVLQFDDLIGDLIITIFDRVKDFVDACVNDGEAEYDPRIFSTATEFIANVQPETVNQYTTLLNQALYILNAQVHTDAEHELFAQQLDELSIDWSSEVEPDLIFFHNIMGPVEARIDNWEGRSSRQLKLALLLNQFAGSPVDEQQLRASVYLHDIGMAILPLAILKKKSPLTESEVTLMRSHVLRSSGFLSDMPHWSQARQFIYQHHERADGKGYPEGLTNEKISDGAKILSLVDAFEAMTHDRAQKIHQKRTLARALNEVTQASGSQFCPYWVNILNAIMAPIIAK